MKAVARAEARPDPTPQPVLVRQVPALPGPTEPEGRRVLLNQALPEGTPMPRHTTMPPRIQKTPYGDVSLTSKWDRTRYLLQASGSLEALKWMFPKMSHPERHTACFRHAFVPAPQPIRSVRSGRNTGISAFKMPSRLRQRLPPRPQQP